MQLLGNRLARTQAGLPVKEEVDDEVLPDATGMGEGGSGVATPVGEKGPAATGGGGGGGGGKGRKKKGKR